MHGCRSSEQYIADGETTALLGVHEGEKVGVKEGVHKRTVVTQVQAYGSSLLSWKPEFNPINS